MINFRKALISPKRPKSAKQSQPKSSAMSMNGSRSQPDNSEEEQTSREGA